MSPESRTSVLRLFLVAGAALIGWLVGFYLGIFGLLALLGLGAGGTQFVVATVLVGALLASLAAWLASNRSRATVMLLSGMAAAVAAIAIVLLMDDDFVLTLLLGGAMVMAATAATAADL